MCNSHILANALTFTLRSSLLFRITSKTFLSITLIGVCGGGKIYRVN